jgi:hypothetical protein
MSASNSWAEFAGLFRSTRQAFLDHERSKTELKALMPEDAKEAVGHGVRAKRSKSGAVSFDFLEAAEPPERKTDGPAHIEKDRLNGGQGNARVPPASAGYRTKAGLTSPRSTLGPEASAALREQLKAGIKDIGSAEEAASWAHR